MGGREEISTMATPIPPYPTRYAEYLSRYSIANNQVTTTWL